MAAEEGEVCAICLDPPIVGVLALACRHRFHAQCLLESFSGETPGQWKCPCCRGLVIAPRFTAQGNFRKTDKLTNTDDAENNRLLSDSSRFNLPPGTYSYKVEDSRWATLQSFLSAAAAALADKGTAAYAESGECMSACYNSSEVLIKHNQSAKREKDAPKSAWSRCMAVAEKVCPPSAASITAFVGHAQLQRLVDPSLPHPAWRAARYFIVVLLSVATVLLSVWMLRYIMYAAGLAVCVAADATSMAAGAYPIEHVCVPMVPDGWLLPIGFGAVGFYITVQLAWLSGATLRHVVLKWDECAAGAIAMWFAVSLGYTAFVYIARFLLTVLVEMLGPAPLGTPCLPTLEGAC